MPLLYEHYQKAKTAFNHKEVDINTAREHLSVVIGIYSIWEDTLAEIPESKMLYREALQLLADTYVMEQDYVGLQNALELFFEVVF